jgi:hypothetical protein
MWHGAGAGMLNPKNVKTEIFHFERHSEEYTLTDKYHLVYTRDTFFVAEPPPASTSLLNVMINESFSSPQLDRIYDDNAISGIELAVRQLVNIQRKTDSEWLALRFSDSRRYIDFEDLVDKGYGNFIQVGLSHILPALPSHILDVIGL